MSKYPSLPYTKAEAREINDGWYSLMRAVEHSAKVEHRITSALKGSKKHFHELTAKARIMRDVRHGMTPSGPATIPNLALEDDDTILCYMVGVYLCGRDGEGRLRDLLDSVNAAWGCAHSRYLDSL